MNQHPTFEMSIDLNVMNHLGIRLYSNVPAVISEAVANAWDADASEVTISLDPANGQIIIKDDGIGMTDKDINEKFLKVGYRRRESGFERTPNGREVMGRKGIGKLSLFSIASEIEVQSAKDGHVNGLVMSLDDIESAIKAGGASYQPDVVQATYRPDQKGTTISLRKLRKSIDHSEGPLRRRLARRFAVIGEERGFDVLVNGRRIGVQDREYIRKVQYVWIYGDRGREASKLAGNVEAVFEREAEFEGWIGTVRNSSDLLNEDDDNLNEIIVMARKRLAQETTLASFGEDGLYASYVIGEVHADWLDDDAKEDIATTSRQALIEDDPRVQVLREELRRELKHIQNRWSGLRRDEATRQATRVEAVRDWFESLGADTRKRAESLFGRINQLRLDDDQRLPLFKYGVLAFEKLRIKDSLDRLEELRDDDVAAYLNAFADQDEIEAQLYYEISLGRLDVIKRFKALVEENVKEKLLQRYFFNHLWLLDPAWDRATTDPIMEKSVLAVVAEADRELKRDEEGDKLGRIDIAYRRSGGEHVIIELKRAGRLLETAELQQQVYLYHRKLKRLLVKPDGSSEGHAIVCVIGRDLRDWSDHDGRKDSAESLKAVNARVITYDNLIENALRAYGAYADASEKAGRITALLDTIDKELKLVADGKTLVAAE